MIVRWVVRLIGFRIAEIFEAGKFLAARNVDNQIARNGEQPGLEFGFAVVLVAALKHANPGFLKQVLGERGIAREEQEITVEALLVLLNEAIKEIRIAAAEASGQDLAFVSHEPGEEYRGPRNRKGESLCAHTILDTGEVVKKTQVKEEVTRQRGNEVRRTSLFADGYSTRELVTPSEVRNKD